MAIEFKLPDIGEGLADGEIIKWLVSEGDQVEEYQPLVEVLTDKATVEIPSPPDGRILKLCAGEGDVVAIGAAILLFAESDDESAEDFAAGVEEFLDEQPIQTYEGEAAEVLGEQGRLFVCVCHAGTVAHARRGRRGHGAASSRQNS